MGNLSFFEKIGLLGAVCMVILGLLPETPPTGWYSWTKLVLGLAGAAALYVKNWRPDLPASARDAAGVVLVGLLLGSTMACVPKHDPVTLSHLMAMRDSQASCPEWVAYEDAKKTGGAAYDPGSARHVRELCSCYAAAGENATKREACALTLGAAIVYERNKIRGGGAR